jgi:hypothetical protein
MDAFPFSESDWQRVKQVTLALLNASLIDDARLEASLFSELLRVLDELRAQYGDHPVLRETEADFLEDPAGRVDAYRTAIRVAEEHHLPTLSIRVSLARVLLENFTDPIRAKSELAACRSELSANADRGEMQEWSELMTECLRQEREDGRS